MEEEHAAQLLELQTEVNALADALAMANVELATAEYNITTLEEKSTNPADIIELISFENSHDVAYHLYHADNAVALALSNELLYWLVGKN